MVILQFLAKMAAVKNGLLILTETINHVLTFISRLLQNRVPNILEMSLHVADNSICVFVHLCVIPFPVCL